MKTIVIEAQRIFRSKKHGMDRVALEMIRGLQSLDTKNLYVIAVGPGPDRCLQETANFRIEVLPSENYFIFEQILLPRLVLKLKADLLHCTSNTAPMVLPCPMVLTLHDVIFMEPKVGNSASWYQKLGRQYRRMFAPMAIRKAKAIITVSHFERRNVLERYPQVINKLKVIYNGVGEQFRILNKKSHSLNITLEDEGYWLMLGNRDPKKNLETTLIAFTNYLKCSKTKKKLVVADMDESYLNQLLSRLGLSSIRDFVEVKSYLSSQELVAVYNRAFGFLYPSLRESFGLPILEAMACGTPVISSSTSAIPEIAGSCAILVDPRSSQQIADSMLVLESDTTLYDLLVDVGATHAQRFGWNNTARQTLNIYIEILQSLA